MSDELDYDDEDDGVRGSSAVAMMLPFVTAIAALVLGALLGIAIGWVIKPDKTLERVVARELTAAELAEVCAPQIEESVGELEDAQHKVQFLEQEVTARESRVTELEDEMKRRAQRGSSLVRELKQAKADLAEAQEQLTIALEEKERLVVELTETKQELAVTQVRLREQVGKTERAKEDAMVNKWYRFINDSQLEICDRGNRKKLGNCRGVVQSTLVSTIRRNKFSHCVRSGQAVPSVLELEKNAALPNFAEMIDEAQKQTKGWYVLFCDPTLPEKDEASTGNLPRGR